MSFDIDTLTSSTRTTVEGISRRIAATDGITKHEEKEARIKNILAHICFFCFLVGFLLLLVLRGFLFVY